MTSTLTPIDRPRIATQLSAVFGVMLPGHWLTLDEIAERVALHHGIYATTPSVSARLRDLRRIEHGGWTVDRRLRSKDKPGHFEYRVTTDGAPL